ncbi:hypothetical protein DMC14_001865 [Metamycoplasma phocicerebrale]|uniref:Uncharacterized protein n=1 Tax=Metamycoplasma phocicerebrale TaxID=142649 RepID=A0A3T0TU95_9BACT|nr:hypothetical protein [Metamycoplasma phocicerebrale]AZZ65529.1 hypothetical protein DMC14_001865 [Metamycoplasma phocicerebrale]
MKNIELKKWNNWKKSYLANSMFFISLLGFLFSAGFLISCFIRKNWFTDDSLKWESYQKYVLPIFTSLFFIYFVLSTIFLGKYMSYGKVYYDENKFEKLEKNLTSNKEYKLKSPNRNFFTIFATIIFITLFSLIMILIILGASGKSNKKSSSWGLRRRSGYNTGLFLSSIILASYVSQGASTVPTMNNNYYPYMEIAQSRIKELWPKVFKLFILTSVFSSIAFVTSIVSVVNIIEIWKAISHISIFDFSLLVFVPLTFGFISIITSLILSNSLRKKSIDFFAMIAARTITDKKTFSEFILNYSTNKELKKDYKTTYDKAYNEKDVNIKL